MRTATPDDEAAVEALMKASAAALFPRFYDEQQAASAVPDGVTIECVSMDKPIERT